MPLLRFANAGVFDGQSLTPREYQTAGSVVAASQPRGPIDHMDEKTLLPRRPFIDNENRQPWHRHMPHGSRKGDFPCIQPRLHLPFDWARAGSASGTPISARTEDSMKRSHLAHAITFTFGAAILAAAQEIPA